MINAYILVRLIPGLESSAMSQMRVIPGVKDVITVFGRWDAIVQVESKTIPALSRMVIGQIRGIQGVQATETLVAAEL
ncbi:MAG: transcriptional regulator, AsnC family [candidate division NC10 bacterium]|nr:transcriptional regulator, AsnC family [candidate division NC10 bacterium]MBM2836079.1 transcriptional regulator, AsnC family [candidate division NC10 bacterium]